MVTWDASRPLCDRRGRLVLELHLIRTLAKLQASNLLSTSCEIFFLLLLVAVITEIKYRTLGCGNTKIGSVNAS